MVHPVNRPRTGTVTRVSLKEVPMSGSSAVRPALVVVSALALAGCGTSYGGGGGSSTPAAQPASSGALHSATTSLGTVLVDGAGHTVYMFSADSKGKSSCSASCLAYWPPVKPGKASGVSAAVGKTTTPAGGQIATVAGWPVYTFAQDTKAGDVKGEGMNTFGGVWYAISPTGKPVKASAKGATSGSSAGSGSSSGSGSGAGGY
jgi:predicted lipoprotein with Yx(FWY)xxD motif